MFSMISFEDFAAAGLKPRPRPFSLRQDPELLSNIGSPVAMRCKLSTGGELKTETPVKGRAS
jgi:hypothetical protein